MRPARSAPTTEAYGPLTAAFDHFNRELFDGALPPVLMTLQRKKRTYGYFSNQRFVNRDGVRADEIALNPVYFALRPAEQVLSTLVHEMVHAWQRHFGKAPRRGYHDKQWAEMMLKVGLCPSDTGQPGGKTTGDHMTHYIIDGGAFMISCRAFLSRAAGIVWFDGHLPADIVAKTTLQEPGGGSVAVSVADPSRTMAATAGTQAAWTLKALRVEAPAAAPVSPAPLTMIEGFKTLTSAMPDVKPTRAKYTCRSCRASVWGRPSLQIACVPCDRRFEQVQEEKTT